MSGIFTLSIACVGGRYLEEPYQFLTRAPVGMTLGELALHILEMVDFDRDDHLDQFYLATAYAARRRGSRRTVNGTTTVRT